MFFELPEEIRSLVFSFDPTHRDYFRQNVMKELKTTLQICRDVYLLTHQFVFIPNFLESYTKSLKKKEIQNFIHFTRAPLYKKYTKVQGFRACLFHIASDIGSLPIKMGRFVMEDSLQVWTSTNIPLA